MYQFQLPEGYASRSKVRGVSQPVCPPHAVELALRLAGRANASRIIDIGGSLRGQLQPDPGRVPIVQLGGLNPSGQGIAADLEEGLVFVPAGLFDGAVVVCAGVAERLRNPAPLFSDLAKVEPTCGAMIIATPDRALTRGPGDNGPPPDLSITREWTADEFVRFLRHCGFRKPYFAGHTASEAAAFSKSSILVIAGADAHWTQPATGLKVAAIINAYNEHDIIREVLQHLYREGVEAHVFDNWSTDGTYELVEAAATDGLCAYLARFPENRTSQFEWADQLRNTAAYARTIDADWVLHYDADELRCSPWKEVSLRDAIGFVDARGYNAIDFTVIHFRFTARQAAHSAPGEAGFEQALRRFEFGGEPPDFVQIKGWKNAVGPVCLDGTGGHEAEFGGRRVFPLNFLTKHYPLRSSEQANRKIFTDRLPRFTKERNTLGWHTHYDGYRGLAEVKGWPDRHLIGWEEAHFASEYLVERISGIGIFPREPEREKDTRVNAYWYLDRSLEIIAASGSMKDAVYLAERAVELSPDELRLVYHLADLWTKCEMRDKAAQLLERSVQTYPGVLQTHRLLIELLASMGRFEEAAAAAGRAADKFPHQLHLRLRKGNLLCEAGRPEEAEDIIRQLLARVPNYANAHFSLSVLLAHSGRLEEAISAAKRAKELSPSIDHFVRHLERLEARLSEQRRRQAGQGGA